VNALEGVEHHFTSLYEVDARGRMVRSSAPGPVLPPRFHLTRTRLGNLWRLRADLEPSLAIRLATLAGRESPLEGTAGGAPPEREEFLRRALEAAAPIVESWAGPVYGFPDALGAPVEIRAELRELEPEDAGRLDTELAFAAEDLGRGVSIGADVGGRIVAVCSCARGDASGPAQAGVETVRAFRRRGYGTAVVQAWAQAVRARGGEPLYSTSWDNAASQALAARLGLVLFGDDRHWR